MEKNNARYKDIDALETLKNYIYSENGHSLPYEITTSEHRDITCYNDDHIVLWLADNTIGKWTSDSIGIYFFEDQRDAMACKLRWL